MQEAFDKLRREHPNSEIAQVIEDAYIAQEPERIKQKEEEQFTQLKEQFKELGFLWFGTRIDQSIGRSRRYDHIPIEQKKEQWSQVLATLKDKPFEKRIELLETLASGMQLRRKDTPSTYRRYIFHVANFGTFKHLPHTSYRLSSLNFTPQSMVFMEAIDEMSGHSDQQKQEYRDFMIEGAKLTGNVGLPELFPGISRWIDHSTSLPPLT